MPPTRQRVRRPSSGTSIRNRFVKSLSSRGNQTPPSSNTASSNFGDSCLLPTRTTQPQPQPLPQPQPCYAVPAAQPLNLVPNGLQNDTAHALSRHHRAVRLISANSTLSKTLEAASRGRQHPEPRVEWRNTMVDVDELVRQAEEDDDPIIRGEAIFPDELIPGHLEFKADDSHKFWKWDIQHQNWYHVYEETKKLVWAPQFLC